MPLKRHTIFLTIAMPQMSFKDIVNRSLVNLQNCEDEPIHIPGSIQPHGFLIAADAATGLINFCSGNVKEFIGAGYEQVLGKQLSDILGNQLATSMLNEQGKASQVEGDIGGKAFLISLHKSGDDIILEAEPDDAEHEQQSDLYTSSKKMLGLMEDNYTLKQLCDVVAKSIKEITGYDRVMVYRFDEEYNGEVFAEAVEEHLEPFLGLHYPHTDIPAQARQLYLINQLRLIVDVNYASVPVYTTSSTASNKSLDMSLCGLRSVSPIHLQYLNNMGVGGTLTISLIHKGKLWGLIACHHYSPLYLGAGIRTAAKLHGHFITSQIDVRLLNEEYEMIAKSDAAYEQITGTRIELTRQALAALVQQEDVLTLCNAAGVSAVAEGEIYKFGDTPANDEIKMLADYLSVYKTSNEFTTDALAATLPQFAGLGQRFPGINYMSFGANSANCIIWYRHETVKEVNWGGDPKKAIEKDAGGLSPRKSFMLWKETVKGKSRKWQPFELKAARLFCNFFQDNLQAVVLNYEHEKQVEISRKLKETNEELENITWVSTHDLQEPLRKIRIMSSLLLTEEQQQLPERFYTLINKMSNSAERMQNLINDILAYTRVQAEEAGEQVDIEKVVNNVTTEMKDLIEETGTTVTTQNLPVVKGINFLLTLLFRNLIDNSIKFAVAGKNPVISITVADNSEAPAALPKNKQFITIKYTDNGIGFDDGYKQKIFDVFARLHDKKDYAGSGIGLAICRKIMLKHGGNISATSAEGEGATFYLQFPVE